MTPRNLMIFGSLFGTVFAIMGAIVAEPSFSVLMFGCGMLFGKGGPRP